MVPIKLSPTRAFTLDIFTITLRIRTEFQVCLNLLNYSTSERSFFTKKTLKGEFIKKEGIIRFYILHNKILKIRRFFLFIY